MSKAIYQPKGKAGEYAKYACNFYVGCSNNCDYCYCKRGLLGHTMGGPVVKLKKCFKDDEDAARQFSKELRANLDEYRKHGIFFSFTTDPLLPETIELTTQAVDICLLYKVPVVLLTKRADFSFPIKWYLDRELITIGFTLTGYDKYEAKASSNDDRIDTMRYYYKMGFHTFASIEPVIDCDASWDMIEKSLDCCDMYKIGLMSGHREYGKADVVDFFNKVNEQVLNWNNSRGDFVRLYWKDSVLDCIGKTREWLMQESDYGHICV